MLIIAENGVNGNGPSGPITPHGPQWIITHCGYDRPASAWGAGVYVATCVPNVATWAMWPRGLKRVELTRVYTTLIQYVACKLYSEVVTSYCWNEYSGHELICHVG